MFIDTIIAEVVLFFIIPVIQLVLAQQLHICIVPHSVMLPCENEGYFEKATS